MFDGLRKDASDTSGFDEQPVEFFPEDEKPAPAVARPAPTPARRRSSGKFLGMTAQQRFIISVMLMIMVCVLGAMFMVVAEKFVF